MDGRMLIPARLAAVCAAAFGALLVLAYAPAPPRSLDGAALRGFAALQGTRLADAAAHFATLGNVGPVILIGAALALVALARGRPRLALGTVALLGATSFGSQLLKAVLAHPRPDGLAGIAHVSPAAFPSGHSTAAMSLALAGVMVAPPRLRPLAAVIGGAGALAVGFSVVLLGWHFPSDVVGGYLLAAGTSSCVLVALRAADLRWPRQDGRAVSRVTARITAPTVATVAATAAIAVGVIGVLALARLTSLADYAQQHMAAILVGPAMAAAGAALLAGVTLSLRRR